MDYCYEFAGIRIFVTGPKEILYSDHGVLTPFISDSTGEEHRLSFALSDHIDAPEGNCVYQEKGVQVYRSGASMVRYAGTCGSSHMRIERSGRNSRITCLRNVYSNGISPKTVLNGVEAEHLIIQNGGVILHASFIRIGQKAILFTAPSGTGKSTQADLWCRYRDAELINGDRAAITVENGLVFAHGIPYSGSSGVAKKAKLPIAAIVYLAQASQNTLEEMKGFHAFRKLWEGCSVNVWDKADVDLASKTVLEILGLVPMCYLACRPDQEAVDTLAAALMDRGCL